MDVGAGRAQDLSAAVGLALGRAGERGAALVREVEGDDRLVRLRVERLLRVLDVRARQLRVVLEDPVAERPSTLLARLGLDHDDPARDLHREAARRGPDALVAERRERGGARRALRRLTRALAARGAGGARALVVVGDLLAALVELRGVVGGRLLCRRARLLADLARREQLARDASARAEQVVLVARRVVLAVVVPLDLLLVVPELALDRRRGAARRDVHRLRARMLLRSGLDRREDVEGRLRLVRREQVRLPVVELELRRRPDLLLGAGRVLDRRETDRDLVCACLLDLGLRDTERVRALPDRLDRVLDRLRRDLRHLRRRATLVDQLDPALEVEPEARLLRERGAGDVDEQRQHEGERDDAQDAEVAFSGAHEVEAVLFGVRTSSSPPSSSYAGKMSAFAGSGRSPSA